MNIILLGYMGCGKTFYAKKLSKITNLPFIDLDSLIEEKEKKFINKIINENGESYFREIENNILNQVLNQKNNFIFATGGGTPCFFNNLDLLNEFGLTIYLKKKPKKLYNFLIKNKYNRPIFNSFKTIEDFFNNFNYREKFYLKSKVTIDCDNLSNIQILTKINNHYNENRFKK
tara:strand:+ start:802 stop:1323 length:522 start_codon:yes stop_codon:yes gene_type:complete